MTQTISEPDQRKQLDVVYSLAYEELKRQARALLRHEGAASISPTTLVNEAWIKLSATPAIAGMSAVHFRRIAGRAMRQILVEAARKRQAQIRGKGAVHVTFSDARWMEREEKIPADVLALDEALLMLSRVSERQAFLVEAQFFGGLSWKEAAEALGISESTAMREWRAARAWLGAQIRRSMQRHGGTETAS